MEDIPALIDNNPELAWPDDLPDAPKFQDMDETPASFNETKSKTRNWIDVLEEQDQRLSAIQLENRTRASEHMFSHLPNSDIDWSLNGRWLCRVQGMSCYGRKFRSEKQLILHLSTQKHQEHDESLALVTSASEPTPAIKREADSDVLQPNSKKPRVKHNSMKSMGGKTMRTYKVKNKRLESPEPPEFCPWTVISDSDEDPENGTLWAQEPKFKHTTDVITGYNEQREIQLRY